MLPSRPAVTANSILFVHLINFMMAPPQKQFNFHSGSYRTCRDESRMLWAKLAQCQTGDAALLPLPCEKSLLSLEWLR